MPTGKPEMSSNILAHSGTDESSGSSVDQLHFYENDKPTRRYQRIKKKQGKALREISSKIELIRSERVEKGSVIGNSDSSEPVVITHDELLDRRVYELEKLQRVRQKEQKKKNSKLCIFWRLCLNVSGILTLLALIGSVATLAYVIACRPDVTILLAVTIQAVTNNNTWSE